MESALVSPFALPEVLATGCLDAVDLDGAVDIAAAADRLIAFAHAVRTRALARIAELRPSASAGHAVDEFATDEVSVALRLSRSVAIQQLDDAHALATRLPEVLQALQDGDIGVPHAHALVQAVEPLSDEHATAVQHQMLTRACSDTPMTLAQFRRLLRRVVHRVDPDGVARRHEHRRAERHVELVPQHDAMAGLWALLPADQAMAIYRRLDDLAHAATTPGDARTLDQRRADVFADLLLADSAQPAPAVPEHGQSQRGHAPRGSRSRIEVQVTVAATTLLGLDGHPGELAGYGPIPAEVARRIAHDPTATWRRLVTDPATGRLLDYGRKTYRPPAALHDYVIARDRTCRFPGCQQPAHRCDLDHTVPFPRGATSADNLGVLCRHHHRLKTHTRWQLEQRDGVFHWTSPSGRRYSRHPEPLAEAVTAPSPSSADDPPPF